MKVDNAQDVYSMMMMKTMMKESLGEGMQFEFMYQSMMNAMMDEKGSSSGGLKSFIQQNQTGQRLDKLEMEIGQVRPQYNFSVDKLNSSDFGKVNSTYMEKLINETTDPKMKSIYLNVDKYSKEYGVDPKLVLAIIKTESNFNPNVKSSAGAMGLMQLMPFNCETFNVKNPFDIEENIRGGIAHFKEYLDRYNGNVEMALMAYNGGPTRMANRGVTDPSHIYKMPKETQNYVPKVLKNYKEEKWR